MNTALRSSFPINTAQGTNPNFATKVRLDPRWGMIREEDRTRPVAADTTGAREVMRQNIALASRTGAMPQPAGDAPAAAQSGTQGPFTMPKPQAERKKITGPTHAPDSFGSNVAAIKAAGPMAQMATDLQASADNSRFAGPGEDALVGTPYEQRYAKGGEVEAPEIDEGEVRGPKGHDKVPAQIENGPPAKLNRGEFVFSTEAVEYYGLKKLKDMLAKAKAAHEADAGDAAEDAAEGETTEESDPMNEDETEAYGEGGLVRGRRKQRGRNKGNGQGEATWFRAAAEQGGFDAAKGVYTKGPFAGMSNAQAQDAAPALWRQLSQRNVAQGETWDAAANGRAAEPQSVPQLPKKYRQMPNAPDLSTPAQFDPVNGKLTRSGASANAAATFKGMADALKVRKATAKQAVADKRKAQIADVPGTVDRAIAAQNEALAADGVTNMGGGVKALSNKYGTGFAAPAAPRPMGSKPGAVMDENGVVDTAKLKGATTTPYVAGTQATPALNMDAREATRASIDQQVAAAAPGAAERLAADRAKEVARVQGNVNKAMMPSTPMLTTAPTTTTSTGTGHKWPGLPQALPDDTPKAYAEASRRKMDTNPAFQFSGR